MAKIRNNLLVIKQESASGGGASDVNFYDYDGTLVQGYTIEQAQALTELPTAPTHTGLVFQEWNYTLAQVNAVTDKLNVGATYETASGKTEVDITLTTVTGLVCTLQNLTGMTSIDWGDGTTDSLLTHTYTEYGDYTIKIAGLTAIGMSSFGKTSHTNAIDMFVAVRFANNFISIGIYAFSYCYSLQSIVIPNSVTSIDSQAFNNCYTFQLIVIPNSVIRIASNVFSNCRSLQSIVIPSSVTSIDSYAFYFCDSLQSVVIPSGVTSIGDNAFQNCYSLTSLVIPSSVTSIGSYAFQNCYSCKEYDFSTHTAVPTLSSTTAFTGINAICKIKVPTALYDDWIVATNWATYADYIVAV